MLKEQDNIIYDTYKRIVRPWDEAGLQYPNVSIKEIAREMGIQNPSNLADTLFKRDVKARDNGRVNGKLILVDEENIPVDNLDEAAKKAAPYKKSVNRANYRSRAPGGGPVVKRRVNKESLRKNLSQYGKERLMVKLVPYDEEAENQKRRQNTKERLAFRWQSTPSPRNTLNDTEPITTRFRVDNLIQTLRTNSVAPIERPRKIKDLTKKALISGQSVVIANWICPRGTSLKFDPETRKLYRSYINVNPEEGFDTDYQLQPDKLSLERRMLRTLEMHNIPFLYLKIVADDNPYCLYPACLRIDGEEATMQTITDYSDYCQRRLTKELDSEDVLVMTWSALLGPELFKKYLDDFEKLKYQDISSYLPPDIISTEMNVLTDHTQPDPSTAPAWSKFTEDCIKYFALEGDYMNQIFGDDVILAWNDSTRIASTIDPIRKAKGLKNLPKIFVLHEQRNGKIIDNF